MYIYAALIPTLWNRIDAKEKRRQLGRKKISRLFSSKLSSSLVTFSIPVFYYIIVGSHLHRLFSVISFLYSPFPAWIDRRPYDRVRNFILYVFPVSARSTLHRTGVCHCYWQCKRQCRERNTRRIAIWSVAYLNSNVAHKARHQISLMFFEFIYFAHLSLSDFVEQGDGVEQRM